MPVVVVKDESTVVEGDREKMPLGCLGPIDREGTIERGKEVGSGYANTCLLYRTGKLSSVIDIE